MKKIIPVVLAIVLIIVIGGVAFGSQILEKYSYSEERADVYEYYSLKSEREVAIVLQDVIVEEKAVLKDGVCYFDLASVHKYFNDRLYIDKTEGLLLISTPSETVRSVIGTSVYVQGGEEKDAGHLISFVETVGETSTYYIAADYVKQHANFSYELFTEPNHMQVYTVWEERTVADVNKDNAVRQLGGVKSPILTNVAAGDTVIVLEQMDTWSKVQTQNAFIGYIENKMLENERTEVPTPVTDYVEPEYTSLTRDYRIGLGWHSVYSVAGNDTLTEVASKAKGMNVIAPTWFSLRDNDGNFESFATTTYVEKAHKLGLEVWGVIDDFNFKSNHSADIDINKVLSSTTSRTNLVSGLVAAAQACGMDGVNVDLEQIGSDYGQDYIQFIRELSIECRKTGLVLSVDNPVPFHFNTYFNIEEQGVVADYVIIMGYDEHGASSKEAGSVASLGYVKQGIDNTIEKVQANKVINALPFYARLWKTEGAEVTSKAYAMTAMQGLLSDYGMTATWDEETNQNYAMVQSGNAFYQIWIEDNQSILAKVNVMQAYDLGGVAAWRLGLETPEVWDILAAYLAQ